MITVVLRDEGNDGYEQVLIYSVDADPTEKHAVFNAVCEERADDLGAKLTKGEKALITILFAFNGNLETVADWRN